VFADLQERRKDETIRMTAFEANHLATTQCYTLLLSAGRTEGH